LRSSPRELGRVGQGEDEGEAKSPSCHNDSSPIFVIGVVVGEVLRADSHDVRPLEKP